MQDGLKRVENNIRSNYRYQRSGQLNLMRVARLLLGQSAQILLSLSLMNVYQSRCASVYDRGEKVAANAQSDCRNHQHPNGQHSAFCSTTPVQKAHEALSKYVQDSRFFACYVALYCFHQGRRVEGCYYSKRNARKNIALKSIIRYKKILIENVETTFVLDFVP